MTKKQELLDFFMWFRENGEKYLGLTIEEMIEEYLTQLHK